MNGLLEKIERIEALIEGAKTEGEKNAAMAAKDRLSQRKIENDKVQLKEYTLYTSDNWHKKLLLAICRKHKIEPYRYHRQKHTTVMVRVNERFLKRVLWKEYLEYSIHLEGLVSEITDNIIEKIHKHEEENIVSGNLE